MFYFLLMLPLGILYFVIATVGICVSIGLVGGSIAAVLLAIRRRRRQHFARRPRDLLRPVAARRAFPAGRRRAAPDGASCTSSAASAAATARSPSTCWSRVPTRRIEACRRMMAALLLLLLVPQAVAAAESPPALRCLPDRDGFLTMRLRGSIEAGRPLDRARARVHRHVAARRPRTCACALPARSPAASSRSCSPRPSSASARPARGVPVNVTLLDGAGERIYGTQGDSRCEFDEVEQQPDRGRRAARPQLSASARADSASAPARALDGDGSVLLTRFDFAGRVTFDEDDPRLRRGHRSHAAGSRPSSPARPSLRPAPARRPGQPPCSRTSSRPRSEVTTATGVARFRGLDRRGRPEPRARPHVCARAAARSRHAVPVRTAAVAAFWMKDTYLSLDLIFIDPAGRVLNVAANARPHSLEPIRSEGDAIAVLEVLRRDGPDDRPSSRATD